MMRKALETAWAVGYSHAKALPNFVSMDDITFEMPVEIGSIVTLTGVVEYTEGAWGRGGGGYSGILLVLVFWGVQYRFRSCLLSSSS